MTGVQTCALPIWPPAASTLSISSGRSGCVPSKQEKDVNVPTHHCPTKVELQKKRNCSKGSYPSKEKFPNVMHGQAIDTTNIQNHQLAVQNDGYDEKWCFCIKLLPRGEHVRQKSGG